jgi:sulfide:quinone oxidoreductase
MATHAHEIVIVGGGNAGLSVAARLRRAEPRLDIAVIDPAEFHYYQPAWTLVGAGLFDVRRTRRLERDVMPPGVRWYRDAVTTFDPDSNRLVAASGAEFTYRFLVAAPGIQLNWSAIPGLAEAIDHGGVCSNYGYEHAQHTERWLREFEGGRAIFTSPSTAVKCGGAPQKIMYLAADQWRRRGILDRSSVEFYTGGTVLFGVQKYLVALERVVRDYGIQVHVRHDLVELRAADKVAVFAVTDPGGPLRRVEVPYDLIHVTPPQSAPDVVRSSHLADANGWIDVDRHTLRHVRFPNVFGLGDATNTPNAKTGAAVRKQAPVVVANLLGARRGAPAQRQYDGYGSCPLLTSHNRVILAEFDYTQQPTETFPFDQSKPRWSMYLLKRYVLPWLYWNGILKGRA